MSRHLWVPRDTPDLSLVSLLELLSEVSHTMAAVDEPIEARVAHLAELLSRRLAVSVTIDVLASEPAVAPDHALQVVPEGESRFAITAGDMLYGWIRVVHDRELVIEERLTLAETTARIALWLGFARRADHARALAEHLQRALLPQRLPRAENVAFDAAYRPATQDAIVGGDWYDGFALPDGRIAFAIGDVAGHGLPAAVVMGEVRQAVRAAAIEAASPAAVLERANTIVNLRDDPTVVTAVFGILDPVTLAFTYACAGHPAPALALDGMASCLLPGGGIPLGVAERVNSHDWTFTLPPGALLLLYTDGALEYDRAIIEGEARLLAIACNIVEERPARPAERLLAEVFAGRTNVDDVAVLALQAVDRNESELSLRASAVPLAVPLLRRAVRDFCARIGLPSDDAHALELCVGELAGNAVLHAYEDDAGELRVEVRRDGDDVLVSVEDWGRWRRHSLREHGGRGLKLLRGLFDRIDIETEHRHTRVLARKRVERA